MDSTPVQDPELLDKVTNLAKRRGFIFPSAEIYGGFRSTYDDGPLGVNMLRNVKQAWWRSMVQTRHDIVGLDAAIMGPPAVWAASGHLETFTDPLVDCLVCKERWREDKIDGVCPNCGSTKFTAPRAFNLMFKTQAGPVEGEGSTAYLRPETAQGIFTNFANVLARPERSRPSASPKSASPFATRAPRKTSSFEPESSNRWRWSTSSRPTAPRSGTGTGSTPASTGTSTSVFPKRFFVSTNTPKKTSRTTPGARPISSSSIPGAGTNSRAWLIAATTT